jgi:hypothetical protein
LADKIENHEIDGRRAGGLQAGELCFAAIDGLGLIAKLMDQCFEEPPLHGIVVGDQVLGDMRPR